MFCFKYLILFLFHVSLFPLWAYQWLFFKFSFAICITNVFISSELFFLIFFPPLSFLEKEIYHSPTKGAKSLDAALCKRKDFMVSLFRIYIANYLSCFQAFYGVWNYCIRYNSVSDTISVQFHQGVNILPYFRIEEELSHGCRGNLGDQIAHSEFQLSFIPHFSDSCHLQFLNHARVWRQNSISRWLFLLQVVIFQLSVLYWPCFLCISLFNMP